MLKIAKRISYISMTRWNFPRIYVNSEYTCAVRARIYDRMCASVVVAVAH